MELDFSIRNSIFNAKSYEALAIEEGITHLQIQCDELNLIETLNKELNHIPSPK